MKPLLLFTKFPRTYWIANIMELFERWAYYGMFVVLSVYLTDPISEGGLGFSNTQRGIMQAIVTGIIYLLPILGGALADRFGFRKILLAAFVCLTSGYFSMGQFSSYATVFSTFLIIAVGASIFKPVISATISKTTTKNTDTIGFGIFYMIVNVGGWIGPFIASRLRDLNWNYVFIMSAVVILLNFILLIFYKEPGRIKNKNQATLGESIFRIFKNMGIALSDKKFVLFIIIMVGFWTTYWQIFFTLPVYITQWVDTTDIYNSSPLLAKIIGTKVEGVGIIRPEQIINIAAFMIIFFQVIVSSLVMKIKPLSSMVLGASVIAFGMGQFAFSTHGLYFILGIVIIAFGEMTSSPRIQEYIGRIAPFDKIALYMGVSYLPMAGGNILGGFLSGFLYDSISEKYNFLKTEITKQGYASIESIQNTDGAILFNKALDYFSMNEKQLTQFLYNTYQPSKIWLIFAAIGAVTVILLFLYNRLLLNKTSK